MEQRSFGTTGLASSMLGMGCSRLGSFLSKGNHREAVATISVAVERGITYFDTSDIYGQGDSERLLGAAPLNARATELMAEAHLDRERDLLPLLAECLER